MMRHTAAFPALGGVLCCSAMVCVALLVGLTPTDAHAQILKSPRGSVSQTIDGTTVDIDYGRPALRGREGLFGGQIFWGHIWTPGADAATTLTLSKDVVIDSVSVPAGKYSVWFLVERGDWELVLNPEWDLYHVPEPKRSDDWISIHVAPDTTAPKTEVLTFDFPEHEAFSTVLRFRWDTREVRLPIAVEPSLDLEVSAEEAAPYAGTYRTEMLEGEWNAEAFTYNMRFHFTDGAFFARMVWQKPADPENPEGGQDWQLLPRVPQVFHPVFFEDGRLVASAPIFFEFLMGDDGRAASFEFRDQKDELIMRGERVE